MVLFRDWVLFLDMVSIGVPPVEDSLTVFTDKLKSAMLLFHMLRHVVLLVSGVLTLGTLPHPQPGLVPTLVHLGGHQG